MVDPISQSRWQEAQAAERTAVCYDRENSRRAYRHIFDYLGIDFDHKGYITEIGCGAYPALGFCLNAQGIVYEPLYFESLDNLAREQKVIWYKHAFESTPYRHQSDEVWIFNCLQHVRDPELLITKAKECAPVIRFFEPVDYPTCVYHPHTFTQQDFERWFGNSVKRYTDRLPGFFDSDYVYGTWENQERV